jgi:hypothetical protein
MDDQMGRHNDYREPKCRGYDDDNTPADLTRRAPRTSNWRLRRRR